jgi:short subunit dehydrogenase-like uncharacterized protein
MAKLMIYGANGYAGALLARAAKARGLKPVLAGRNNAEVSILAAALKLESRIFPLNKISKSDLKGISVVLHAAGPFSATAEPMMRACLAQRVHYLDITGEIDVFALADRLDRDAQTAGIVLCPGVGFDVVPTDCLAALLKQALPGASELLLAFEVGGGQSRGTAKTSIEVMKSGGLVRVQGALKRVPIVYKIADIPFSANHVRRAMTIPWGDVYTAFVSTEIPNIEVYMAMPAATIASFKRTRWMVPILSLKPAQAWLKRRVERRKINRYENGGPDESRRAASSTFVYGRVRSATHQCEARVQLPNGYDVTVDSALSIAQFVLAGTDASGFATPSMLCGGEFLHTLAGAKVSIGRVKKL